MTVLVLKGQFYRALESAFKVDGRCGHRYFDSKKFHGLAIFKFSIVPAKEWKKNVYRALGFKRYESWLADVIDFL